MLWHLLGAISAMVHVSVFYLGSDMQFRSIMVMSGFPKSCIHLHQKKMKDVDGLLSWNRAYSCTVLVDLFKVEHDFSPVGHSSWAGIYFIFCMVCVVLLKLKAFPDHFLE